MLYIYKSLVIPKIAISSTAITYGQFGYLPGILSALNNKSKIKFLLSGRLSNNITVLRARKLAIFWVFCLRCVSHSSRFLNISGVQFSSILRTSHSSVQNSSQHFMLLLYDFKGRDKRLAAALTTSTLCLIISL